MALAQAGEIRDRLMEVHNLAKSDFEIVPINTSGDQIQNHALSQVGGKGLFTKEIELALLDDSIDIAVHSAKDMPTVLPVGLDIVCYLKREDVREAFISNLSKTLMDMPQNSLIGTASLRRQSMVKRIRPDLEVVLLRGNVQTRLQKIAAEHADATILALAGLKRLKMVDKVASIFEIDSFLPAVGQGAICVEAKSSNKPVFEILDAINDRKTSDCLTAERAFLEVMDGSCKTPIAGLARTSGENLVLRCELLTPDGCQSVKVERQGNRMDAKSIGQEAGWELKGLAGPDLVDKL